MRIYQKNYDFLGEEALLIHEGLKLNEKVSFKINTDILDLNNGELIDISVKMPGSAINSPYEIPYEDYRIEFIHNNIKYIIKNMLMTEWKEVYLYSYNLKFKASKITSEIKEKPDLIEFLIPNLLIGHDEMIMEENIINKTNFTLNFKNNIYKISLEANPEFNNKDISNNKLKSSITNKISFDLNNVEYNLNHIELIKDNLIDLIGLSYGAFRPNLITNFYRNNLLIGQNIYSKNIINSNKILPLIPNQYSGILSNFINTTFNRYIELNDFEKNYIKKIASLIFKSINKLDLKESFDIINELYKYLNINQDLIKLNDEYKDGDYKLLYSHINNLHKILLSKLEYKGKYFNWSGILPNIEDFM